MPWFNEWEETFEWVQCKPCLEFMPMEVRKCANSLARLI